VAAIAPMALAGLLPTARSAGAVDLALGVPAGDPPARAVEAAVAALRSGANQYADPAGLSELRLAVAADLAACRGVLVDSDREVTVCTGATEGVLLALLAVTDPGDEVLIPEPFYENHPGAVKLAGAVPRFVPTTLAGWRLDPEALDAAITPRTTAVLLSNPHNPTGRVFDHVEFAGLAAVCERHDLTLITDEVYDRFTYDGRAHLSPIGLDIGLRERSVVVGGLSKVYRMTGWRLGYCVARPELTGALRRAHERVTLGAPHPLQRGAAALDVADAAVVEALRAEFQDRRDLVCEGLRRAGFDVDPPEGGWFVLAGTSGLGRSSEHVARELVENARVLVAPGGSFFARDAAGRDWIRVALVRERAELAAAVERMAEHLRRTPLGATRRD
jgi:aspartate/methionine/tyrosine aminotransferase